MKKLIILFLSLLYITNIYASALDKVQNILAKPKTLVGNFKQIQKIALLSTPLISSGKFTLTKNTGLQWEQTSPFTSSLIVTANKIEQQITDNPPTIITKQQQPMVFSFTKLFLGIFNGDIKTIKEYFKIYFHGNINAWKITLKPVTSPLNQAISSIEMSGGKYINTIIINEIKKNQMIIYLSNVKEQ